MSDDFLSLEADLTAAGEKIRPFAKKALQYTAFNIKRDWREGADISDDAAIVGPYDRAITYDTKDSRSEVSVEIGPELGRPGGTAGFIEDGGPGVRVAPIHAGRNALEASEQDFYEGLEIAAADAIEGGSGPMALG